MNRAAVLLALALGVTTPLLLSVAAQTPGFSLTFSPAAVYMNTTETKTVTATVTSSTYSGSINLTANAFNFNVTITPTQATLAAGGKADFTATLKLKDGSGQGSYTIRFNAQAGNASSTADLNVTVTPPTGSTSGYPQGSGTNPPSQADCAKAGVAPPSITPAAALISCNWQPPSSTSAGGYSSFEFNVTSVDTEYTITQPYPSQWVPNHVHVHGRHVDGFSFQNGTFTLRAKPALMPTYAASGSLIPRLMVGVLCYAPGEHQEFAGVTISTNSTVNVGTDWGFENGAFRVTVKVEGVSGTRGFYEGFFPVSFLRSGNYSAANTTVKFDGRAIEAIKTESAKGLTILLADYAHSEHRIVQDFASASAVGGGGGAGTGNGTPGIGWLISMLSVGLALLVGARQRPD